MILQDLIKTLTREDYLQIGVIHKEWVSFLQPDVSAERIAHTMQDFGEMLSGLRVEPSEYILMALPTFENGTPETHAELFLKDSLLEKHGIIAERNMPQYQETDTKDVFTEIIQSAFHLGEDVSHKILEYSTFVSVQITLQNIKLRTVIEH